ncbi:MAG TPA: carbohydrate kinase family protein [Streptosporangiaceae bacterium]|nr:carbohydrate kinase family protein [Streptosporangiaceae bacterium]
MSVVSVLVLGDLCVDTIVTDRLPVSWRQAADSGEVVFRVPLREQVGGSAFHFARQAAAAGFRPIIVGSVGTDLAGDKVVSTLADEAIPSWILRCNPAPTAQSIMAYDTHGARMMITSQVSANDELTADFIQVSLPGLPPPSVVWLPGHCLRDRASVRWTAVAEALAYSRHAGARVVLDLVPHDFYRLFPTINDITSAIGPVDGISAELATLRRWFHPDCPRLPLDKEVLAATVAEALDVVPFVMARYHDGTNYWQLAATRAGMRSAETRAVPTSAKLAGYGDYLACLALRCYLDALPGRAGRSADDHPQVPGSRAAGLGASAEQGRRL